MKKPNYKLKAKVLKTELPQLLRKISFSKYVYDYNYSIEDIRENCENEEFIKELLQKDKLKKYAINGSTRLKYEIHIKNNYTHEEIEEAERINKANYAKRERLEKRIKKIVDTGQAVFCTLTFTDEIFKTTSEETRKRYVARYLKSQKIEYVANADYGEKNGREHYHALVNNRITPTDWKYGACNVEKIRTKDKGTNSRLSKYIVKLTNHAIKETTKQNYIIYSRS